MRTPALTLIFAVVLTGPWSAPASQAAVETWTESRTIGPGQYGYVVPGGTPRAIATSRALPPGTEASERSSKNLDQIKLPSNQPTDVNKAAAEVNSKRSKFLAE